MNEWKTSEWQTRVSEDLKQIQDQEYPVGEDAPEMGPLGLQPFGADEWTDLKEDTLNNGGAMHSYSRTAVSYCWASPRSANQTSLVHSHRSYDRHRLHGRTLQQALKVIWFQAEIIKEFMKDRITTYFRRFGDDEDTIRQGYDNFDRVRQAKKEFDDGPRHRSISPRDTIHKPTS